MSDLVSRRRISRIVGAKRHDTFHLAKAVSAEQRVYILHSKECVKSHRDLRDCPYSVALDQGINPKEWVEDVPILVVIRDGRLFPEFRLESSR